MTRQKSFNPRPRTSGRREIHASAVRGSGCFNPRPRTSGRQENVEKYESNNMFQSTPPYKRATFCGLIGATQVQDVSIHAPVQAGDLSTALSSGQTYVSIHAPVQAGDVWMSVNETQ